MSKGFPITIILFLASFQLLCSNQPKQSVRAIHVGYKAPLALPDGSIQIASSFYAVFYFNDLTAYKIQYTFDSSWTGKSVLNEERFNFFVFNNDSAFGYYYRPQSVTGYNNRLRVDSVKRKISFESSNLDTIIHLLPDTFYMDPQKNVLTEFYKRPVKDKEIYNLTLFYDKRLNYTEESFSRKLDSVKKMKLVKMIFSFEERYDEDYKMTFPKREIVFEMKEKEVKDIQDVQNAVRGYKNFLN